MTLLLETKNHKLKRSQQLKVDGQEEVERARDLVTKLLNLKLLSEVVEFGILEIFVIL